MVEDNAPTHFRACCRNVTKVLKKIGVMTPELDARLLISDALGLEGAAFFLQPDRLLSEDELNRIAQRLARRMAGEPVSRIIGKRGFWKHEFRLCPDVLDPRPDSETLIEVALELVPPVVGLSKKMRVLDLGTGTGALLLSLLLEWPQARGIGIDISEKALAMARENAVHLGCAERTEFLLSNWLDVFGEKECDPFDLILCNPPYIPEGEIDGLAREVAGFDPRRALDGGADGLDAYREIIPSLRQFLTPQGIVLFEIGEGQHDDLSSLFSRSGLRMIGGDNGCHKDLAGIIRCVAGALA